MNIHDFVNDLKEKFAREIKDYIQTTFEVIICDLAAKHDLDEELIRDTIQRTLNKSIKKCSVITKLGHSCKYTATEGKDLCLKHYNMS
jgi:predicted house-cleaning noncanonical NTP pyrophosphatase (MazG superfamily)